MTSGAFLWPLLWELSAITAFVATAFLVYVVLKALWAEIGPMLSLLFHRGRNSGSGP